MTLDLAKAIRRYIVYDTQLSDWFDEGDVWFGEPPQARGNTQMEPPILVFSFVGAGNPERGFDGGRIERVRVQFDVFHTDNEELLEIIDLLSDELDRAKLPFESGSTKQNLMMLALGSPLIRPHARSKDNQFTWSATRDFEAKVQV